MAHSDPNRGTLLAKWRTKLIVHARSPTPGGFLVGPASLGVQTLLHHCSADALALPWLGWVERFDHQRCEPIYTRSFVV